MLNVDRQGPGSGLGLAYALAEPSRSLVQNSVSPHRATTLLEPWKAITILLDQHDHSILAYLKVARSLEQNVQYCPRHGSLSSDQVLAVWALKDCADEEIKTWLKQARNLCSSDRPNYPLSHTLQEPGYAPGVPSQQTRDKTNTADEATKAANLYWCTVCEDRRPYKNVSDWRKHEKAHVDTYVCMFVGALEETEGGAKCSLCGISNPSEEHLFTHKIQTCGQGVPGSFSCKRRTDLVRHLQKYHNVQGKAQGEAIADKWKETIKKQAWSCGFCIHLVHTFGDRLKHIAKHFERGQTLEEWDITKVMEGLLLQPGMSSAWKTQLAASSMAWESSEIIWKKHLVQDLQHDLEVGPFDTKHAAALAARAYDARQSQSNLFKDGESLDFAPLHRAPGPTAIVPTSDYDSLVERDFEVNWNHPQSQFVANPAETLHYGVSDLGKISMATYDNGTFPASSSDGGNSLMEAPWLSIPGM